MIPNEVDDINGDVALASERLGREAPVNAVVVELAHAIERGDLEPGPSNLELLIGRTPKSTVPR